MSHINDALKKVQKEKDSLYQRYGNIISDPVYHRTGRGKRWMITGSVIVLILLALPVFMLLRYNVSSDTNNSNMAIIQDAGDKTEVGGQRSEVRGLKSEVGSQRSEVGGRRSEVRGLKSEVGRRKAEKEKDEHRTSNVQHRTSNEKQKKQGAELARRQSGGVGSPARRTAGKQKSEVGGLRSEVGGRKAEVGGQKSEVRGTLPVEVKKVPEMPAKTGDVKRLYNEALNYQRNGNPAMAEEVYRKILVINPEFVTGLNNLGVICMSRKENKEAADMFRKAIDLKADYVDPYYNLACLYSLSGNISKSLYYLKMAVSINNSVKNWAKNDKDLERLRVSETYKKIME